MHGIPVYAGPGQGTSGTRYAIDTDDAGGAAPAGFTLEKAFNSITSRDGQSVTITGLAVVPVTMAPSAAGNCTGPPPTQGGKPPNLLQMRGRLASFSKSAFTGLDPQEPQV